MKIRKATRCPHCGFDNVAVFRIKKNQRYASAVVTCDCNEGGCDRDYVATAQVSVDVTNVVTKKVVSEEDAYTKKVEVAAIAQDDLGAGESADFNYIKAFAQERDFSESVERKQLRALWTAYCLRHNLDCDTKQYDERLAEIWQAVVYQADVFADSEEFRDMRAFDLYMGEELS